MELISSEYKADEIRLEINAERQEVWVTDASGDSVWLPFAVVHGLHAAISQIMGGSDE